MNKVLITGASGFIGYKLMEYFYNNKYDVIGWDKQRLNNNLPIIQVNILDKEDVSENLSKQKPDIIVHCAGNADVGKSIKYPADDYNGNVTVTHNLLFSLHKLNMKKTRFVFLSSASVYGNPVKLPITEDMPLNPLSPYALHKIMCENICKYFIINYNMDIKIARIFSAYGSGLKKQIFWDMFNKYKNTGKLQMFGSGNESRDYIHVNDIAKVIFLLSTVETKHIFFNVANGQEITIKKATEIFAECMGIEFDKICFNGIVREGDPLNWRADINKIRTLGYKKSIEMKSGIKEYCNWLKKLN